MRIATVLLLERMGANYKVVAELNVEAEPDRDSCLSGNPGGRCCVTRDLSTERQFEVNSSYLYGVVDLRVSPNMGQTNVGVINRPGCSFNTNEYTPGGTLKNCNNPTDQPLRMFQFIIGELRFVFVHLVDQIVPSLVLQTMSLLRLLPHHPLVAHLPLTNQPQKLSLLPSLLTPLQSPLLHLPQE